MEQYLKDIDSDIVAKSKAYCTNVSMDWEDLAQDFRLRLIEQFELFDPNKANFRTWAVKVMENYIKNLYKRKDIMNETLSLDDLKDKGFDI